MVDRVPDDGAVASEAFWRDMLLQHFAILLAAHGLAGRRIDEAALTELAAQTVRDFRDNKLAGIAVQPDAETLGEAISDLEETLDYVITEARERKSREAATDQDMNPAGP